MGSKSNLTGILLRRPRGDKQTQGKRPCDPGGRDWNHAAKRKVSPRTAENHQKLGRGKEGFFPRLQREAGSINSLIMDF